jgi:outer membrane protein insertion porin family
MRHPLVAACNLTASLTAVAVCSVASNAQAAAPILVPPVDTTPVKDWVVPTDAPNIPVVAAIAKPEVLTQPESAQPEVLAPIKEVVAPIVIAAKPVVIPAEVIAAKPVMIPAKLVTPRLVTPKPATPQPVAPKAVTPKPPTPKPPTPKPPTPKPPTPIALAPDFAVMVLDVNLVGLDPEVGAIVRKQLVTQAGQQSSLNQIQQDIARILETGLVGNASFTTQLTADGINVSFQANPTLVKAIDISNNAKILTPAIVDQIFQAQLGQAIKPSGLNQGVRDVNQWYRDNGYALSRAIGLEPNASGRLKLTVEEGKIDRIAIQFVDEFGRTVDDKGKVIQGKTKETFIRREIKSQPGDIFQASKVQQDLQQLIKTGLFTDAGISIENENKQNTIVYNLVEGVNRQANLGGGYSTDLGLYGSASLNDRNVAGTGNQLGGNILIGAKDILFDGKFTKPFRDSQPQDLGYSVNVLRQRGVSRVFDSKIPLANGDQVREGRIGGGISVDKTIGDWSSSAALNFARISQRDANGNLVQADNLGNALSLSGTGIDNALTLGFTASRDQRDDRRDPKSGSVLSLSTEQTLPVLGGAAANKLTANYSQYVPINIFNKNNTDRAKQEVLAFNVQGGTTIGNLAPYNAFTLGGVSSVRGFGQSELGIGRSYLQASAEYRFPVLAAVGGTLFADYATDLGSASGVLGEPGNDRGRPGSGLGVGAGVRVKSPLGLLRADWGFTNRGDSRVQFSIGEKF